MEQPELKETRKGFGKGRKRHQHFYGDDYAQIETRPDLAETWDAQFDQVNDVPLRNEKDAERGYIPSYGGSERMGAPRPWNKVRPRAEGV